MHLIILCRLYYCHETGRFVRCVAMLVYLAVPLLMLLPRLRA
jgi:hypothetical protein